MNNLKEIRLSRGYSLEELAKEMGMTKQAIGWYETKDAHKIPFEKAEMLAKILECSPLEILGEENFRYPFDEEADKIILIKIIINKLQNQNIKETLLNIIDQKYLFLSNPDYYYTDDNGNIGIYDDIPDEAKESYLDYLKHHGLITNRRTYLDSKFCDNGMFQRFRIDAGYSQKELAKVSGLSLSTICKIETSSGTWPTPRTISKLAKVYKMSFSELQDAVRLKLGE